MINQLLGNYFYSTEIVNYMKSIEIQKNILNKPVSPEYIGSLPATIFILKKDIWFLDDLVETPKNTESDSPSKIDRVDLKVRGKTFNSFKNHILNPLSNQEEQKEILEEICFQEGLKADLAKNSFSKNLENLMNDPKSSKLFKKTVELFLTSNDAFYLDLFLNVVGKENQLLIEKEFLKNYHDFIGELL